MPSRWLRFNFFVFLYGISHAAMFQKSFVDSLHTKLVFVTASTGPFTKQSQFIPKLLAGMCIRLTGFWQFISKTVTMVINRKKEKEVLNSNQISIIYRAYFDQFHVNKSFKCESFIKLLIYVARPRSERNIKAAFSLHHLWINCM